MQNGNGSLQWFSKRGPQISSISINLTTYANVQASQQTN